MDYFNKSHNVIPVAKQILVLIGLVLIVASTGLAAPSYHKVKAMPGDGIYSILRRYKLDNHSCNFKQFYKLNKLKKNARLKAGANYFVPILVYSFNGKTIRSSIGINDWDLAVRIQKYNELLFEESVRTETFKKSKILWVPHHIINCPESDLNVATPVTTNPEESNVNGAKGKRHFPIFGKKYARTPLESNKLKGKVFYVTSGHGGPDPGAIGRRGNYALCEDEYAYDVALRLCRRLIAHGATAYMITRDPNDGIRDDKFLKCDIDEVLWGNIRMSRHHKERLFQRSDVVNELYKKHSLQGVTDQKLICIHIDSRTRGERLDLFFYHKPKSKESKALATKLHKTMKKKYKKYRKNGQYHGTVSSRDLHMLRETQPTSVYIELANILNTYDQQRIILESNRRALAQWLFEGLLY